MAPRAIAINCSLKHKKDEPSSTDRMIGVVAGKLRDFGVDTSETLRMSDYNILPGVTSDEGSGDDWPELRRKILDHDILIFGTPIWLGQPSSIAKRVLERMDAFFSEADDQGRYPSFGKVAVVGVVGNEDGAHHVTAELFQALNDVGWTIPASCSCYWVGEAMHDTDFKDLDQVPDPVEKTATLLASSAAHLASLLQQQPYPGEPQGKRQQQ